jgi:hypothetical protein
MADDRYRRDREEDYPERRHPTAREAERDLRRPRRRACGRTNPRTFQVLRSKSPCAVSPCDLLGLWFRANPA